MRKIDGHGFFYRKPFEFKKYTLPVSVMEIWVITWKGIFYNDIWTVHELLDYSIFESLESFLGINWYAYVLQISDNF